MAYVVFIPFRVYGRGISQNDWFTVSHLLEKYDACHQLSVLAPTAPQSYPYQKECGYSEQVDGMFFNAVSCPDSGQFPKSLVPQRKVSKKQMFS